MLSYMLALFLSVFGGQPMYNSTAGVNPPPPDTPVTSSDDDPDIGIQHISRPGHSPN